MQSTRMYASPAKHGVLRQRANCHLIFLHKAPVIKRRDSLQISPRMNFSRSLPAIEVLNVLWHSKQTYFYNCTKTVPCIIRFRKAYFTQLRMATVDQAVLDHVENEWKEILGKVKHHGNAIFVLGPMGAGKTTIIEKKFKTHPRFRHYAYVDTDEIMGSIDAFSADKVEQYYPLARKIAIRLTDWILTQKISFVAEGTCVKVAELIEYMERLKSSGYKVRVNRLPLVPLDEILERAKHRKNRIVADDVVTSIYKNANLGLMELYDYNRHENYSLFQDLDLNDVKNHTLNSVKPICAT